MSHTANARLTDPAATALGWQPADSWPLAEEPLAPGTPVEVQDRDPANYPTATVVAAEVRSGPGGARAGYVIRYDANGCEVWVREYDVRERPAGYKGTHRAR